MLTEIEKRQIRNRWNELREAWQCYQDRSAWLAENEEDPQWPERDAATARLGLKVGRLRDDLATYLGCSPPLVSERLGEMSSDDAE